jgi:hypothetical protein
MGTPTFYGTEIALRCRILLDELEPHASAVKAPNPELGSLRPTFLLSMAYPIIIIPFERFMKHRGNPYSLKQHEGELGEQFQKKIKGKYGLRWLPASDAQEWSWTRIEIASVELGRGFPFDQDQHSLDTHLQERLADTQSKTDVENQTTQVLIEVLRHSLAHGNVLYLDDDGSVAHGRPVEKFLFCNERRGGAQNHIQAYEFLEVSVDGFAGFLRSWATWLAGLHQEVTKKPANS